MGMDYDIVHACPNDDTIYFEETAHLTQCPNTTCNAPRYRSDVKENKVLAKVWNFFKLI